MARIALLVGGALVNALDFSGSNYLFTMLQSSGADEEQKRHDKAIEQLQATHEAWTKRRTERMDCIAEDLCRQGHSLKTFQDVDEATRLYAEVTGKSIKDLGPEPQLSDFTPRATAKKTARLLSSSSEWPQPVWSPTSSPSNPKWPCGVWGTVSPEWQRPTRPK